MGPYREWCTVDDLAIWMKHLKSLNSKLSVGTTGDLMTMRWIDFLILTGNAHTIYLQDRNATDIFGVRTQLVWSHDTKYENCNSLADTSFRLDFDWERFKRRAPIPSVFRSLGYAPQRGSVKPPWSAHKSTLMTGDTLPMMVSATGDLVHQIAAKV